MKWSENAWQTIESQYQSILKLPFIEGLISGTLPMEKFQFYLAQDSLYLEHFSRVLAMIGARAENSDDKNNFIGFADTTIMIETSLHNYYFEKYGIDERGIMEPACHHYVHFLKSSAAFEKVEIAMASVLPCYWIYKRVGEFIHANQRRIDNPYHEWIATYVGDGYGTETARAIMICDTVAANCTKETRRKMTTAFEMGAKMEYQFWQGAYELKKWALL